MRILTNPKTFRDYLLLSVLCLLCSFLIWLPHLLKLNFYGLDFSQGFNTIYRNYDGLEYVIIAKSWYNPQIITHLPQSMPDLYYAAHFPGYAVLIGLFAPIMGYLKSMIFVSLTFTIFSVLAFYSLIKDFKMSDHPLLLSIIFLLLPARWVIVHSVGSSEPVFIFFVIAALYFFLKFEMEMKWRYIHLAGLMGLAAQITRPPGILLFVALGLFVLYKVFAGRLNIPKAVIYYHPLLLIPLSLLGIFYLYFLQYGDFLAYFHSGDNIHLAFPPFQVFNKNQYWVGDIWLEDIIYIYILSLLGGLMLLKQKLYPLGFFVLTFVAASISIAHRDVSRYVLPVFPFVLIAYEKILTSKEFKIVLIVVALGIYLYSQNFIINNTAPYPNLELFN